MTSENSKSQAAPAADPQTRGPARRRLLKGSFAAPAAMTLCSGSALAAASSCITPLIGTSASPNVTSTNTSATGFWRVQQYTSSIGGAKWVKGSDVVTLNGAGKTPFLTNIDYYKTGMGTTSSPGVGTKTTALSTVGTLSPTPAEYIAVRVDSNGNIYGIQGIGTVATGTTAPMTASCWTSFKV